MHSCHNPFHCFVPPYLIRQLAESEDPEIRSLALEAIALDTAARTTRKTLATMPAMAAIPSITGTKERRVYDMRYKRFPLPGKLRRSEGDPVSTDEVVNEAYDHAGVVYDFYADIFERNSLDNRGMALISSVHLDRKWNNAFWNGEQMAYGDGDGRLFNRFTKALDVVAHEMTHGVVTHESNLEYEYESGALNEHFADVMEALVKQWYLKQTADQSDWLIGADIVGAEFPGKAIRTFKAEKAYEKDPQPKHLQDKYTGDDDNGGVHINSGIPNHAFYQVALELGGFAWEKAGRIWYQTLRNLNKSSQFQEAANMTYAVAGTLYGADSLEQQAVKKGWNAVGISV